MVDSSIQIGESSGFSDHLPDFFIVGAPKCGTTALSEYLRVHPNVSFSVPKEPRYFNDDFLHRDIESLEDYLLCFRDGPIKPLARGEASVVYMYSQSAVPNILQLVPDARFIVMLRNPIDAAYSLHWQSLHSCNEDLTDFEEAWRLQEVRRRGKSLPKHVRVPETLQYGAMFQYGEQLERLFGHVSTENVHVVIYEDFKDNPKKAYLDVLEFLRLPKATLPEFRVINASKRLRYPLLERLVRSGVHIKRALGIKRPWGMTSPIKRWNTKYEGRPPLRRGFMHELKSYFRADIHKASSLVGRDLTSWLDD